MYPSVEKAALHYFSEGRALASYIANQTAWASMASAAGEYNPKLRHKRAVTEVNAECFAALRATGCWPILWQRRSSGVFRTEAQKLKNAIKHALNRPQERFYYLNIDISGNEHPDVTCDLIFR